ncbi:MAG: hypothetical protein R2710_15160 [Acidimicrobiales bacterium]
MTDTVTPGTASLHERYKRALPSFLVTTPNPSPSSGAKAATSGTRTITATSTSSVACSPR